ncbi:MAG: EAL domain-containing protein [Lachnospiraceae bacterium]|nr:EAL domain-containing protein [Lachnospiraceae bacterium]
MNSIKSGVLIYSGGRAEFESLKNVLDADYNVYVANHREDIMVVLEAQDIDFALVDISEDVEEGLDFIARLKFSARYHSVLVVAFHDELDDDIRNRAASAGVSYCFPYPLNPLLIKNLIGIFVSTYVEDKKKFLKKDEAHTNLVDDVIDILNIGVLTLSQREKFRIEFIGKRAAELLGYDIGDTEDNILLDKDFDAFIHPDDIVRFYSAVSNIFEMGKRISFKTRLKNENGNYYSYEAHIKNCTYVHGIKMLSLVINEADSGFRGDADIFENPQHDRTRYDLLTNVFNKDTFFEETAKMIEENPGKTYIVSIWDIDRFKAINEMLGSKTGDKLLIDFANFLKANLDDSLCTYGRIESDHFVTCCSARFHEKAEKNIKAILDSQIVWHTLDNSIFMHVGMYRLDINDRDIAIACDRASMALHAIKNSYANRMNYFSQEMRESLVVEQELVKESEDAFKNRDFFVMFQPIIDARTREIVSAEALVRWRKPDGTHISPGVFIPTFEKNGIVTRVDLYVLDQVCAFQADRISRGLKTVPVSVNLSRVDFYDERLYEKLMNIISKYRLSSEHIKFEITESAYMDQPQELMRVMDRLRDAGYQILMDDFGSGFSSLNMLKDFPVNILKIDMKFMDSIDVSERASNILYSVIRMAKSIDMQIVAEGVETGNQFEMLKNMDCDCIQGFYFYKPLPRKEFEERLREQEKEMPASVIKSFYKILLLSDDEAQKEDLESLFDYEAEISLCGTEEKIEETLKLTFTNVNLILIDYDALPEECAVFVEVMQQKPFYSGIPVLALTTRENLESFEKYIKDEGIADIIIRPYNRTVLKQRIRRTIDYYGVESERRAITLLRKSVLLRQQMNSFFEDSLTGIARVVVEKDRDLTIKEISYINDRFLNLHMITLDEALRKGKLSDLMPHMMFPEVDSVEKSVHLAMDNNRQFVTKSYSILSNDGHTKDVVVACSIKYRGSDMQIDIVLIETTDIRADSTHVTTECLNKYLGETRNVNTWRYYIDSDIADFYSATPEGRYIRTVVHSALDHFVVKLQAVNRDEVKQKMTGLIERLKQGETEVSCDLNFTTEKDGVFTENYKRLTYYLGDSALNGTRYAVGILDDMNEKIKDGHMLFRQKQYDKLMHLDSEIYIEADLTENLIINKECLKPLVPYGVGLDATYDKVIPAFVATVEKEDYDKVIGTINRKELVRQYRQGNTYIVIDYMAKTEAVPVWTWYELTAVLGENPLNGNIMLGMKVVKAEEGKEGLMTEKDSLTGLYTRIMFERKINRMIEEKEKEEEYVFALIDVDNFKKINDSFGHNVGDSILKTISRVLAANLGSGSTVSRLGGDEFAVYMPKIENRDEIVKVFDNINKETVLEFGMGKDDAENIVITTSIGIVASDDNDLNFHKLYSKASLALNKAKEAGKNTYSLYEQLFE